MVINRTQHHSVNPLISNMVSCTEDGDVPIEITALTSTTNNDGSPDPYFDPNDSRVGLNIVKDDDGDDHEDEDDDHSLSNSSYSASSSSSSCSSSYCTTTGDEKDDHETDDDDDDDHSRVSSATNASECSHGSLQREQWWQQQQAKLQVQLQQEQEQQEQEESRRVKRSSSFSCLPMDNANYSGGGTGGGIRKSASTLVAAAAAQVADEDDDDDDDDERPNANFTWAAGKPAKDDNSRVPRKDRTPRNKPAATNTTTKAAVSSLRRSKSSASDPGLGPKKSSLKRTSSYGTGDDMIPINKDRRAWKQMAPPKGDSPKSVRKRKVFASLARVGALTGNVRRSRSTGSLERMANAAQVHRLDEETKKKEEKATAAEAATASYNTETNAHLTQFKRAPPKRRVSFGSVGIREHALTIGDNPSCRSGAPTSLDWEFADKDTVHIESYEFKRRPLRKSSSRELKMNATLRKHLLLDSGKTEEEIEHAAEEVQKVRKQREFTKEVMIPLTKVEAVVESAARKAKRLLHLPGHGAGKGNH